MPLTTWFLALYLINQAQTGLSALTLKRKLGVSYPTAWRLHHKLMQAMIEREEIYTLRGAVQADDATWAGKIPAARPDEGLRTKSLLLPQSRWMRRGIPSTRDLPRSRDLPVPP